MHGQEYTTSPPPPQRCLPRARAQLLLGIYLVVYECRALTRVSDHHHSCPFCVYHRTTHPRGPFISMLSALYTVVHTYQIQLEGMKSRDTQDPADLRFRPITRLPLGEYNTPPRFCVTLPLLDFFSDAWEL